MCTQPVSGVQHCLQALSDAVNARVDDQKCAFQIQVGAELLPCCGLRLKEVRVRAIGDEGEFCGRDAALEQPVSGPADNARQVGAIGRALADLDQAVGRISAVRSTVGARLSAIESQADQRSVELIELERTLSEIEDLDYAEAISRFNLRSVSLQAAQQSYTMFARLSLFDFIR